MITANPALGQAEPDAADKSVTVKLPGGVGNLLNVLSQFGSTGVLCLFLWHLVSVSMPTMQESFHRELQAERQNFREEMKAQRDQDSLRTKELANAIRELAADIRRH